MSTIMQKLASRKLWLAIAGVATGIALALGVESSEISAVAGAVTAIVSVVTYIITEGKIDTAAVGKAMETTQSAVSAVSADGAVTAAETVATEE